jgi:GAF domain-containing protein
MRRRLVAKLGGTGLAVRVLGEVTQAVNSSVDLETVLATIVAKATQLSGTEAGAIYVFDDAEQEFQLRATDGIDESIVAELRRSHIRLLICQAAMALGTLANQ